MSQFFASSTHFSVAFPLTKSSRATASSPSSLTAEVAGRWSQSGGTGDPEFAVDVVASAIAGDNGRSDQPGRRHGNVRSQRRGMNASISLISKKEATQAFWRRSEEH